MFSETFAMVAGQKNDCFFTQMMEFEIVDQLTHNRIRVRDFSDVRLSGILLIVFRYRFVWSVRIVKMCPEEKAFFTIGIEPAGCLLKRIRASPLNAGKTEMFFL